MLTVFAKMSSWTALTWYIYRDNKNNYENKYENNYFGNFIMKIFNFKSD